MVYATVSDALETDHIRLPATLQTFASNACWRLAEASRQPWLLDSVFVPSSWLMLLLKSNLRRLKQEQIVSLWDAKYASTSRTTVVGWASFAGGCRSGGCGECRERLLCERDATALASSWSCHFITYVLNHSHRNCANRFNAYPQRQS